MDAPRTAPIRPKSLVALIGLAGVAVLSGVATVFAVILVLNLVLPAFQPADDDTLRERLPVLVGYMAGAGVGLLVFAVGSRRLIRRR